MNVNFKKLISSALVVCGFITTLSADDQNNLRATVGFSRANPKSNIFKFSLNDRGGTDHQELHPYEVLSSNDVSCNDTNPYGPQIFPQGNGCGKKTRGSTWGHNNIPPFYVLIYIMKL